MPPRKPPYVVAIVAANAATSADLRDYFERAGVRAYEARALRVEALKSATTAIVLFPDDFPEHEMLAYLRAARALQPRPALVAVTRHPRRFDQIQADDDGAACELVVLPRPSFGWTILDAVQAQVRLSADT